MDGSKEQKYPGVRPKPDEEIKWDRKRPPESELLFRERNKTIPQRLVPHFQALEDGRTVTAKVRDRDALDKHPSTKDLPKAEKDKIFEYWPHWTSTREQVHALSELRNDMAKEAGKAHKVAEVFARQEEFGNLSIPDRLRVTTTVLEKQFQNAALIVASTSATEIEEPLVKELFKERSAYANTVSKLRDTALRFAEEIEKRTVDSIIDGREQKEYDALLAAARHLTQRKGTE